MALVIITMPTLFKHFATPKQEDTLVTTIRQGYGDIICIYMISILFVIMNVDQVGHLTDFLYKYVQEFALYAHSCACGLSRFVERMLSDNRSPSSNPSHCLVFLQQNNFSTIIDALYSGL